MNVRSFLKKDAPLSGTSFREGNRSSIREGGKEMAPDVAREQLRVDKAVFYRENGQTNAVFDL